MDYKEYVKRLIKENNEAMMCKINKNRASQALVDLLEEEITNFDYDKDTDLTYIFSLFDYLIMSLNENENLKKQLETRFTYIHNMIKSILHVDVDYNNKVHRSKYKLLQNIINKMENSMLRIYYDNPVDYDPTKEEFFDYIIFKLKYVNVINSAIEKFPHLANSTDKEGIPLIERITDKYIEALHNYLSDKNLGPLDDLIYYDKVIDIFLNSEKIKIDTYNRTNMLNKIKDYYKNEICLTTRHKEKLSFFINSISNKLMGIKEDDSLDYLDYKYEVHSKFKEAHNLEAKTIYIHNQNIELPKQTRKIYTFDGENAMEIDDALSIEHNDGRYYLGVHIADPTAYIPRESILMNEAERRTTSIYVGNTCIPMYPLLLSGDLMSLNEGVPRYAMSYYFEIDERTGELLNFEVKPEIITVTKNLTYDYFNECLDHGTDDIEFFNTLVNLTNVAELLKNVYDENEVYNEFHNDMSKSISSSTVEKAMIYTNHHIAKYFDIHGLPFIYRCHKINEKDMAQLSKLQANLKDRDNTAQILSNIDMIKNMFPRAYYTRHNVGHYGLGTEYYSHSTSPLRRLADNIVNECIKKFMIDEYNTEDVKKYEERIDYLSEIINTKRASIDDYEIQYARKRRNEN